MGLERRMRGVCLALAVLASACGKDDPKKSREAYPGYDPPPLAELLATATREPRRDPPQPYTEPRRVEVPGIKREALPPLIPRAPSGRPKMTESQGIALVVDDTLSDPIT